MKKKRIGILTGGGDCPGLNAVIRAVVNHARGTYGYDVVGIEDSFQGLHEERTVDLDDRRVADIITRGGTILGSSNRANPFAYPIKQADGGERIDDVSDRCIGNLDRLDVEALILVGGDGTMGMGRKLLDKGVKIVGVPRATTGSSSAR
jgi:6-phosphofructokinase